jgi:hypothetical protein
MVMTRGADVEVQLWKMQSRYLKSSDLKKGGEGHFNFVGYPSPLLAADLIIPAPSAPASPRLPSAIMAVLNPPAVDGPVVPVQSTRTSSCISIHWCYVFLQ